jgi:hypothetical protein
MYGVQPCITERVFKANFIMMRTLFVLVIGLCGATLFAQQSETRNPGSFKGIKVSDGIDVYLKKGDKETLRVEVSGTSINNVLTEVSGDNLRIQISEGRYKGSRTVKVYVTYVDLNRLSASSASTIYGDEVIKTRSLALHASSAGTIEVKVDVETLVVGASSAGDIEVKGQTKKAEIEASSAGDVDGYYLEAEEASIRASSAGSVKLTVTKQIDARASSGGSIRYRGSPPKTNTNTSSGGSVKKSS